jgi:tRNA pseudouridine38-40 synthase
MSTTHNYKVILAYDGTDFCGWEKQAQGERTVRGVVEDGLHRLTGRRVNVQAAGRTDSGVHALGQVISFQLEKEMETATLWRGLNALIPRDVRVLSAEAVPADFHARYSVRCKTYFYQILEHRFDDPFRSRFFHRVDRLPGIERIRAAAHPLAGERDFAAMRASGSDVRTSHRNVMSIKVRRGKDWIRIFITADGFLYRMVRNMVALIMAQAYGELSRDDAEKILKSRDRTIAPPTAPAKGLFLWNVRY